MMSTQNFKRLKKIQIIKRLFVDIHIPTPISKNFKFVPDFESKFQEKRIENKIGLESINKDFFNSLNDRLDGHRKKLFPGWIV